MKTLTPEAIANAEAFARARGGRNLTPEEKALYRPPVPPGTPLSEDAWRFIDECLAGQHGGATVNGEYYLRIKAKNATEMGGVLAGNRYYVNSRSLPGAS